MHKKRVNSVLKGVLVAGTAIGGASVMTEANVVYAAENEFSEGEEIVLPLEDEAEEDEASMLDSMSVSAAESTALSTEASASASDQLIADSASAASTSVSLSESAV